MKKVLSCLLLCALMLGMVGAFTACQDPAPQEEFIVATNAPFEPFEYIGTDGKMYGVDMEIAAGFAAKKGYKLVIKNIDFNTILNQVNAGYADIGMAGMTIDATRLATNDFTDTYYNASQKLIVAKDCTLFDACQTAADVEAVIKGLEGKKLGYQNGTTGNWYVAGDADWGYDGFANVTATGYGTASAAVLDLKNGNIFGVVVDGAPAAALVAANADNVKLIDISLTEEQYAFAVKKGNTTLVQEFNAYLAEIKADGTFDQILAKYFEGEGEKVGYEIFRG